MRRRSAFIDGHGTTTSRSPTLADRRHDFSHPSPRTRKPLRNAEQCMSLCMSHHANNPCTFLSHCRNPTHTAMPKQHLRWGRPVSFRCHPVTAGLTLVAAVSSRHAPRRTGNFPLPLFPAVQSHPSTPTRGQPRHRSSPKRALSARQLASRPPRAAWTPPVVSTPLAWAHRARPFVGAVRSMLSSAVLPPPRLC